ncbi:MAG: FkbM family methyltransferase [Bacteroidetes bacterium]|uniref:FkbM family methyltransferase n=1 Tax=Phnomibacter sp. TaxID=2836217 RepID=UPI002FDD62D4|nr:FkbM family methyltransferase [Bacteroidota bacterium]
MKHFIYRFLQANMLFCLRLYAMGQRKLNIIQAGANDGKSIDNMFRLITLPKSHAIVLEPVPHIFSQLKKNYAAYPQVRPMQIAVGDNDAISSLPFHYLKPVPGEPFLEMYNLWGSFSRQHLENFRGNVPNFDTLFCMEEVPCLTINALYKQSGFEQLNILATDTEGYDGKIIDSVDFEVVRPHIIWFEHYHIPKPELIRLILKLRKENYRCYSLGYDTLCVHRRVQWADALLRFMRFVHPNWYLPPNCSAELKAA